LPELSNFGRLTGHTEMIGSAKWSQLFPGVSNCVDRVPYLSSLTKARIALAHSERQLSETISHGKSSHR
jgi:hypothetical protein